MTTQKIILYLETFTFGSLQMIKVTVLGLRKRNMERLYKHPMGNHTRNYIVNNFITAEKQEDIESLRLSTGGYELHEDYYLAFTSKRY